MPSLRGHHLICLHFFSGEGYNEAYIVNLRNILRIAKKEWIEICDGADDVCRRCPYLQKSKCKYSQDADEEIHEMDRKALDLLKLTNDIIINWNSIKKIIPGIFPQ